ncbi:hypothetical protein C8Q78DRAFT_718129 [Trametes maxima]|nr:hypothetical protein C8Q78DRAFT_718129 [Trametes maxima]
MYLLGRLLSGSKRAFGGPFGENGCSNFFPPFGFSCTPNDGTTTTATETQTQTKTATPTPLPPQTTVITSATIVTSVAVVTSGDTITVGTTFMSGSTVTSLITPTPTHSVSTIAPNTSDTTPLSGTSSIPATRASSQSSATTPGPNTNIDATTLSEPIRSTGTDVIHPVETTTVASTSSPTAAIVEQETRRMNPGEIVAICIACVSVLTLCVIIWRAWRRRRQSDRATIPAGNEELPDEDRTVHSLHARNMSLTNIHPANIPALPHRPAGGFGDILEKRDDAFGSPDDTASASSPTTSSLFSPTSPAPLLPAHTLSSCRVPSTVAESVTVPRSQFRGAWDDPPPTPDVRPSSLATSEGPAHLRSQGRHGYLMATAENCRPSRDTVHGSRLFGGDETSEVDLGPLPEYSRY